MGGLQRDGFCPCWKAPEPRLQSRAQPDRSTVPPTLSAAGPCYAGDLPCMPAITRGINIHTAYTWGSFSMKLKRVLYFPYQYHVTRGDVHIRLSRLFAPGWGRAVSGRRTVLWTIAELGGHTADTRGICPPPSPGSSSCCGPRNATAHSSNTILTAEGSFGCHVLPTKLLNKVITCMCLTH